jgi:hypothetical protein
MPFGLYGPYPEQFTPTAFIPDWYGLDLTALGAEDPLPPTQTLRPGQWLVDIVDKFSGTRLNCLPKDVLRKIACSNGSGEMEHKAVHNPLGTTSVSEDSLGRALAEWRRRSGLPYDLHDWTDPERGHIPPVDFWVRAVRGFAMWLFDATPLRELSLHIGDYIDTREEHTMAGHKHSGSDHRMPWCQSHLCHMITARHQNSRDYFDTKLGRHLQELYVLRILKNDSIGSRVRRGVHKRQREFF